MITPLAALCRLYIRGGCQTTLPPNVQVRRRGYAYVIYYNGDDEVGGVVVTETPSGDTQLRPYVKDPVELIFA